MSTQGYHQNLSCQHKVVIKISKGRMWRLNLIQKASIAINSLFPEIKKAKTCNSVVESNYHNLIK